jgi:hypothetical protein
MCFARQRILINPRLVIILSYGVSKKCTAVAEHREGMASSSEGARVFYDFLIWALVRPQLFASAVLPPRGYREIHLQNNQKLACAIAAILSTCTGVARAATASDTDAGAIE